MIQFNTFDPTDSNAAMDAAERSNKLETCLLLLQKQMKAWRKLDTGPHDVNDVVAHWIKLITQGIKKA